MRVSIALPPRFRLLVPPTSCTLAEHAGQQCDDIELRPPGWNRVETSLPITRWRCTFCTSTSGDWPATVTVSWTEPTFNSTLMVAVNEPLICTPDR